MAMLLHTINQAALVKSTDNSGNSCNMRASSKKGRLFSGGLFSGYSVPRKNPHNCDRADNDRLNAVTAPAEINMLSARTSPLSTNNLNAFFML
jgi:hypothetical protein